MSTAQNWIGDGKRFGIRELRLAERAAREQWPIPDSLRAAAVDRVGMIILNSESSARETIAAARALLAFSKANFQSIAQALKADAHESAIESDERAKKALAMAAMPYRPGFTDEDFEDADDSSDHSAPSCPTCPEPADADDSSCAISPLPADASPQPSLLCPAPSSVSESAPERAERFVFVSPLSSATADSSSAPDAPSPPLPPVPTETPTASVRKQPSAVSRPPARIECRPSAIDDLPLELVTHVELFAEDPTPTAPAIERRDSARFRFRVGKGVDLWVPPETLIPRLPPGPERDLLWNHRLRFCRVEDPNRYEPD